MDGPPRSVRTSYAFKPQQRPPSLHGHSSRSEGAEPVAAARVNSAGADMVLTAADRAMRPMAAHPTGVRRHSRPVGCQPLLVGHSGNDADESRRGTDEASGTVEPVRVAWLGELDPRQDHLKMPVFDTPCAASITILALCTSPALGRRHRGMFGVLIGLGSGIGITIGILIASVACR